MYALLLFAALQNAQERVEVELVLKLDSSERFAFSPDGSLLAYYTREGKLEILPTSDLKAVAADDDLGVAKWSSRSHSGLCTPAFSPDGAEIYAQVVHGAVDVIDVKTRARSRRIALERRDGSPLLVDAVIPTKRHLFVNSKDGEGFMHAQHANTSRWSSLVCAMSIAADSEGERIVALGSPLQLNGDRILRYGSNNCKISQCTELDRSANLMAVPRDFSKLYLADHTKSEVYVVDSESFQVKSSHVVRVHDPFAARPMGTTEISVSARLMGLTVSPDGGWLGVPAIDGKVYLFRTAGMKPAGTIDHKRHVLFASLSVGAKFIAVLVDGQGIRVYRKK